MTTIMIINARIVTLRGPDGPRRGGALADLGVIENGYTPGAALVASAMNQLMNSPN